MKLKKDCIRDLLLYLEKNLDYGKEIHANSITLKKYSKSDILYTCERLLESMIINARTEKWILSEQPIIIISSISAKGYEFLDSIRSPKIWQEIKTRLKGIERLTIEIISQIAAALILESSKK